MKSYRFVIFVALTSLLTFPAYSSEIEPAYQDLELLRTQALEFLNRLPDLSKTSRISIGNIDPRLKLTPCSNIDFLMPSNSNQRGNIRLNVRCLAPQPWSLFVSASILESKTYLITRTALEKNHAIDKQDIISTEVFQPHTPPGAINDLQLILGRNLAHPLLAGSTIRMTDLLPESSLTRGQTVKIISKGNGFQITRTGQLLNNTNSGQKAQARTSSNQVITGTARSGGIIEMPAH